MKKDNGMYFWVIIFGLPIYLLMEHPIIFWLVFVPLVVWFVATVVKWFRSSKASLSGLFSAMGILGLILILAILMGR